MVVLLSAAVFAQSQNPVRKSTIRGRVTDTGGYVDPGVGIIVRPASGGPLIRTTTTAAGHYEVGAISPGDFDVFAFLNGFETIRLIDARVRDSYFELDLRLRLRNVLECVVVPEPPFGTIDGDVTDPKGFPLPFAVVEVRQLSGTQIYGGRYLDAFGYADADGHFSANAPAGHHQVSATYPGYAAQARDVSTTVSNTVTLNLTASPVRYSGSNSVESLHTWTKCGRLGFENPAPAPTSRPR